MEEVNQEIGQKRSWISRSFKGDRVVWGLVVLFMVYGLLAVYSSSVSVAYKSYGGNTTYFLSSQFFMLALSLVIIYVIHKLPYKIYSSLAGIFLAISAILLVVTIFFGVTINGATRWLEILGVRIQTSDIAKLALVIYLARAISHYQDELKDFMVVTKYMFVPIAVICALIVKDNLSTAGMVFGICMVIMYIGRIPFKFLLSYLVIAIIGVVLIAAALDIITKENRVATWKGRIETFISGESDPDADYQSNQAKIAISTGGLFGKAPGKSTQRNILPQSNSDYIFAIIIEEYGFLFGAFPLVLAYMILMFRGISIAKKCETAFPAYLTLGLSIMIVTQALLNMMVAVGLFPVTGQTLPMVSWGRSSVLVMSFAIGVILSVSRVNNARIKKEELPEEEMTDDGIKI